MQHDVTQPVSYGGVEREMKCLIWRMRLQLNEPEAGGFPGRGVRCLARGKALQSGGAGVSSITPGAMDNTIEARRASKGEIMRS